MRWDRKEAARLAGALGLALLIAGYVRYTVLEELLLTNKILLIAGGVLVLAWMVLDFGAIVGFFSKRSSKLGTNTSVLIIAVLAILVFINYLGVRHHKTWDLTSEKLYTLSDQTKKIVKPIRSNITIFLFAKSSDPEAQELRDQMAEYENLNPHIHFRVVDPQERPDLTKKYDIARMDQVIVVNGARVERLEDTTEQDITSAILKATSNTVKTVCFVEGHGEKSITATDGKGYSAVAVELGKENYQVKSINLVTSNDVPADCSALVDVGPGIPLVVDYGASPIVRNFKGTMTFFPLARTVSIADTSKTEPVSVQLLMTSAASFTVPNLGNGTVKYDPATDQRGPLSLGVAAEKKEGSVDARLVVIGNSVFATNQWVGQQRNGDLFFNAINWLTEEENLISIRPKQPTNRRVTLTEAQQRELSWFSMVFLPLFVILAGIYVWVKRR